MAHLSSAFKKAVLYTVLNLSLIGGLTSKAQAQSRTNNRETTLGIDVQQKAWSNDSNYRNELSVIQQRYEARLQQLEANLNSNLQRENSTYIKNMNSVAKNATRSNRNNSDLRRILNGVSSGSDAVSKQAQHNARVNLLKSNYEISVAEAKQNVLKQVQTLDNKYSNQYQRAQKQVSSQSTQSPQDKMRDKAINDMYQTHVNSAKKAGFLPQTFEDFKAQKEKEQQQRQQKQLKNNR